MYVLIAQILLYFVVINDYFKDKVNVLVGTSYIIFIEVQCV
jgi:hypothetical protein